MRLQHIISNPKKSIIVGLAIARGCYYIIKYRLIYNKIRIQYPFRAYAPVKTIGNGSVFIDKGCSVYKNAFNGLTIVTLSSDAKVLIGKDCALGGLTVRCRNQISIGDRTITAYSLVQDDFLINREKINIINNNIITAKTDTIIIRENVWLGGRSIVLGGCVIGKDSVLSLGSLCYDTTISDYSLVTSSPVKRCLPIDKILLLKGER